MLPAMSWSSEDIIKSRSALIKRELAINALRNKADGLDDEAASALRDEVARQTAQLDQDWEDWQMLSDAHAEAKRASEPPRDCTPEERLAECDQLDDRYGELLAWVEAQINATDDDRGRWSLEATKMGWLEERENVRDLRDRWAATFAGPSSLSARPAPVAVCARPRTAPRPRGAGRPRAASRASSRGGDSGDDSSGEPDGSHALARPGRALLHALIARWSARVKDAPGGD